MDRIRSSGDAPCRELPLPWPTARTTLSPYIPSSVTIASLLLPNAHANMLPRAVGGKYIRTTVIILFDCTTRGSEKDAAWSWILVISVVDASSPCTWVRAGGSVRRWCLVTMAPFELIKLTIRGFVLHKVFRIRSYSCSISVWFLTDERLSPVLICFRWLAI